MIITDRTAEITYGDTGQTVSIYPPEWTDGVPSSPTASVYQGELGNDDASEFSPTVTADGVSTTTATNAAGYSQSAQTGGRRRVTLTSTSGISVGTSYVLENAFGQRELVTPIAVTTTYVDLDADLAYDYATSSTFKGCKLTFTVDATWVATLQKVLLPQVPSYRVLWRYTIASTARRRYTYLRLVRQASKHGVGIRHLRQYWPDISFEEDAAVRGQGYQYTCDAAFDQVRVDMMLSGVQPESVRDTEMVQQLVIAKVFDLLASVGKTPKGRAVESWVKECAARYQDLLARTVAVTLKVAVDQSTRGGISREPVGQLWLSR